MPRSIAAPLHARKTLAARGECRFRLVWGQSFHLLPKTRHSARQNTVNPDSFKHCILVGTCGRPVCISRACYSTGSAQGVHRCRPTLRTVATDGDLNANVHASTPCLLHPQATRLHVSCVEAPELGPATGLTATPHTNCSAVHRAACKTDSNTTRVHPFRVADQIPGCKQPSCLVLPGCGECHRVQDTCL